MAGNLRPTSPTSVDKPKRSPSVIPRALADGHGCPWTGAPCRCASTASASDDGDRAEGTGAVVEVVAIVYHRLAPHCPRGFLVFPLFASPVSYPERGAPVTQKE